MMENTIEQRIAERVVTLLQEHKFKIEAKRWPEIMGVETAAQYMDRTVSAVRNLVQDGVLPATKGDGRLQIRRIDIDRWAEKSVEWQR
jgi:excisionase family DNA binding protein